MRAAADRPQPRQKHAEGEPEPGLLLCCKAPKNSNNCEQRDHHGAGLTDLVRIQKVNMHLFIVEKRYACVLAGGAPVIRAAIRAETRESVWRQSEQSA
jgi:hypothetical protein